MWGVGTWVCGPRYVVRAQVQGLGLMTTGSGGDDDESAISARHIAGHQCTSEYVAVWEEVRRP